MIHCYCRVSTSRQDDRAQTADLRKWADGKEVKWHHEKASGKTMGRPVWQTLEASLRPGDTVVVWRLDRLGRTASGLTKLFDAFVSQGINLVSLREAIDLSGPAGRLMANIVGSIAQFENEVRRERILSGIAAAKEEDPSKYQGGRAKGKLNSKTLAKAKHVKDLAKAGHSVASISRTTGMTRRTVSSLLA